MPMTAGSRIDSSGKRAGVTPTFSTPRAARHDAGSSVYEPVKRSHGVALWCAHAAARSARLMPANARVVRIRGVSGHHLKREKLVGIRRARAHFVAVVDECRVH